MKKLKNVIMGLLANNPLDALKKVGLFVMKTLSSRQFVVPVYQLYTSHETQRCLYLSNFLIIKKKIITAVRDNSKSAFVSSEFLSQYEKFVLHRMTHKKKTSFEWR